MALGGPSIGPINDDPGVTLPAPKAPRACPPLSPDQQAIAQAIANRCRLGLDLLLKFLAARSKAQEAQAVQDAREAAQKQAAIEGAAYGAAAAVAAAVNAIPVYGQLISAIIATGIALAKLFQRIGGAQVAQGPRYSAPQAVLGQGQLKGLPWPSYRGFTSYAFYYLVADPGGPPQEHPAALLRFAELVNVTLGVYSERVGVDLRCVFKEWGQINGYRSVLATTTSFLQDGSWDQGPPAYAIEALLPEGWQEAAKGGDFEAWLRKALDAPAKPEPRPIDPGIGIVPEHLQAAARGQRERAGAPVSQNNAFTGEIRTGPAAVDPPAAGGGAAAAALLALGGVGLLGVLLALGRRRKGR